MTQELRRQLVLESNKILPNGDDLPAAELEQQILQTSSLLLEQARLLQQEQDRTRKSAIRSASCRSSRPMPAAR